MSEFDRQSKIFAEKTAKPDVVIKAYSMMKTTDKDGNAIAFWFLSDEDTVTMVDMREEDEISSSGN